MRLWTTLVGTAFAASSLVACGGSSSWPSSGGASGGDGGGGSGATSPDDGGGAGQTQIPPDGGPGSPAGGGDGSSSGGEGGGSGGSGAGSDAGTVVDLDAGTTFAVAQPISGIPSPTTVPLRGPGIILMGGGTDVDAAIVWMHDTLAGSPTAKLGNIVVFNTQTAPPAIDNAYTSYIFGLAPFQSVQTLYLGGYKNDGNKAPEATVADVEIAAYYVSRADGVFFAGGDQADYVSWSEKSPALMNALAALYARGGIIGGTSAGCAIMGPYVFDDLVADDQGADPATADVIKNPYEPSISFTRGMLAFPSLPGVFADPHFVTRDRFGRLAGFLARQYADGFAAGGVVGVGIDESNALLVDKNGLARLVQQPGGTQAAAGTGAYVIQPGGPATTCASGKPLLYSAVKVTRLASPATDTFDFARGCGTGTSFTVSVDGSKSSPYSPGPYTAAGAATKCP